MGGVLAHPNVSAGIILGLGCEVNQIDYYLSDGGQGPGGYPPVLRVGRRGAPLVG